MSGRSDILASNLRYLRQLTNRNQAETADLLGLSRNMYLRYEAGSSIPPVDKLEALSEIYGVTVTILTDCDLLSDSPDARCSVPIRDGLCDLIGQFEALSAISRKVVMEEIRLLQDLESGAYGPA